MPSLSSSLIKPRIASVPGLSPRKRDIVAIEKLGRERYQPAAFLSAVFESYGIREIYANSVGKAVLDRPDIRDDFIKRALRGIKLEENLAITFKGLPCLIYIYYEGKTLCITTNETAPRTAAASTPNKKPKWRKDVATVFSEEAGRDSVHPDKRPSLDDIEGHPLSASDNYLLEMMIRGEISREDYPHLVSLRPLTYPREAQLTNLFWRVIV